MNRYATKDKGQQRKHHFILIGDKHDNTLQQIPIINPSLHLSCRRLICLLKVRF